MSELHSETNITTLAMTIRVKLVDLNHTGISPTETNGTTAKHVSKECLGAVVGLAAEKLDRAFSSESQRVSDSDYTTSEVCMLTGSRIPVADFETHIETCSICANRVELQLDFMETLEVAVYQRRATTDSPKIRGAMLISAPELNFAVCGELEVG